jgi:predicted anti-sigma-YlaC factor YlaD
MITRVDRHNVDSTRSTPNGSTVCPAARDYLSARADDEAAVDDTFETHVASCPACSTFAEQIARLNRKVRLRAVRPDPAFVEQVMAGSAPARLGRGGWLRPALAWCGVVVGVQSMRPLLLGEIDGAPAHVARHVGAAGLALAIGFVFAAIRPQRAAGLLPYVGALFGATVLGAVVDTISGDRSAIAELTHVAEMVGIALLWLVAGAPGWSRLIELARSVRHPGAPHATS